MAQPAQKNLYSGLPDTPGVYIMRDRKGSVLYVGKAGNLKRRVSSYFLRPHDARIELLVSKIARIDIEGRDTAIEALILEAELIKQWGPPFNIREKDDKSFLYVDVTREEFPRVLLTRGKDLGKEGYKISRRFGPFTSASSLRAALKIIRRIFPWSTHPPFLIAKAGRPCFEYEVGLCPGTCAGLISKTEYRRNIRHILLFFEGKKERVIRALEKDMASAARKTDYERAERMRRQIFALRHIQDIAFISEDKFSEPSTDDSRPPVPVRIEGYDISNISGTSAVGSMVVFRNGAPDKDEYRKFRIRTVEGSDDFAMLAEVLRRRFARSASAGAPSGRAAGAPWPLPDLILIDGGKGQVSAVSRIMGEYGLKIPIIGLAKGPERKRNDLIGTIPKGLKVNMPTLIKVRDEAHRFAVAYHKKLRGQRFFQ